MSTSKRPDTRRRDNIHKQGRKKLPRLLARDGYKCHWCSVHLVLCRKPPSQIVTAGKDWLIWKDGDSTRKSFWATTDHLIPVREGGKNELPNLVASCGPCNRRRTAKYVDPNRDISQWKGSPTCKCGNQKKEEQRKCVECCRASEIIRGFCQITYISKEEGLCRHCSKPLEPFKVVKNVGLFYGCATCIKVDVLPALERILKIDPEIPSEAFMLGRILRQLFGKSDGFPPNPVDGQEFVDDKNVRWRWYDSLKAWGKLVERKCGGCCHHRHVGVDPAVPGADKTVVTVFEKPETPPDCGSGT